MGSKYWFSFYGHQRYHSDSESRVNPKNDLLCVVLSQHAAFVPVPMAGAQIMSSLELDHFHKVFLPHTSHAFAFVSLWNDFKWSFNPSKFCRSYQTFLTSSHYSRSSQHPRKHQRCYSSKKPVSSCAHLYSQLLPRWWLSGLFCSMIWFYWNPLLKDLQAKIQPNSQYQWKCATVGWIDLCTLSIPIIVGLLFHAALRIMFFPTWTGSGSVDRGVVE